MVGTGGAYGRIAATATTFSYTRIANNGGKVTDSWTITQHNHGPFPTPPPPPPAPPPPPPPPPPTPGHCTTVKIHHTEGCFNYSSWKQGSVGPVLPNYQPSVDNAKLTLESCGAACYKTNPSSLAGVVGGDRCFCGTAADLATAAAKALAAPKDTCETMACKGNANERVCGGSGMLLVYAYSCD
jgi:hypothetical protein